MIEPGSDPVGTPGWPAMLGASAATVLLVLLATPPVGLEFLHWVAWAPLLWAQLRRPSLPWALGTVVVAYCGLGWWFAPAVSDFAKLSGLLTWPLMVLVVGATGLPYAPVLASVGALRERLGDAWPLVFALLFVVAEGVSDVVSLFPSSLAISQLRWPAMVQVVSITGVGGVTLLLALASALVAAGADDLSTGRRPAPLPWVVLAVLLGANLAFGSWRVAGIDAALATAETRDVAMVQSGIDMGTWRIDRKGSTAFFIDRTRMLEPGTVDLVVWPEIAWGRRPGRPEGGEPTKSGTSLIKVAGAGAFDLITGVNTRLDEHHADGSRTTRTFNSAVLVQHDRIAAVHDKALLMPFSEYLPLQDWWPEPLHGWLWGLAGKYTPTHRITLLPAAGLQVGTPICYESLKSGHMLQYVDADLLVTITNDAWFGDTRAPHLSGLSSAMRSIELGRTQVRVGYSGLSLVAEPHGRIRDRIEPFRREVRVVTVPVLRVDTIYARWGRWFVWLCALIAGVALVVARVRASPSR